MQMYQKCLIRYFNAFINFIPNTLESFDTSRIVILQFALCGLDVIDGISSLADKRKEEIVEWIYSLQIVNQQCVDGFRGGYFPQNCQNKTYMSCHATMAYSSLTCLTVLGDDLSRIDKEGLARAISRLQNDDGCFTAALDCPEADVRFVYSALAACKLIDNYSGVDIKKAFEFLVKCHNLDGGFGQRPDAESHGGSTYCVLASLDIIGRLDEFLGHPDHLDRKERLVHWLICRQKEGFHGRPHKEDDSCYTFWVGASLKILGHADLIEFSALKNFLCQTYDDRSGGFCKLKNYKPADPLHTYLTLAGLASCKQELKNQSPPSQPSDTADLPIDPCNDNSETLLSQLIDQLLPLNPTLNITQRSLPKYKSLTLSDNLRNTLTIE